MTSRNNNGLDVNENNEGNAKLPLYSRSTFALNHTIMFKS